MPAFGGYSPFPRRFGGGKPRVQTIHNSLNAALGSGYSVERSTKVWAENMAAARCLSVGYGTNQRMAHAWDPDRMPLEVLKRWEKLLAILPDPEASVRVRRAAVKTILERAGRATITTQIADEVKAAMGDLFVALEFIDLSIATVISPDNSYPFGVQDDSTPWSSTTAKILVLTDKPEAMPITEYLDKVAKAKINLESVLPSWVTYVIYHAPDGHSPYAVSGGASRAGIYCDTPNTLDFCVFAH